MKLYRLASGSASETTTSSNEVSLLENVVVRGDPPRWGRSP